MSLEIDELSPISFLMAYGFKMMRNVKGEKKTIYIEVPSENIQSEIDKIMAGTNTEIDHWLSGKDIALVNDDMIIYVKEVF